MTIKMPLWSVGAATTLLSPLVVAISQKPGRPELWIGWDYWFYYNVVVWGVIGMIYFFENLIKKESG